MLNVQGDKHTDHELLGLVNQGIIIWTQDDKEKLYVLCNAGLVICGVWQQDETGWWFCHITLTSEGEQYLSKPPVKTDKERIAELEAALQKIYDETVYWFVAQSSQEPIDLLATIEGYCEAVLSKESEG